MFDLVQLGLWEGGVEVLDGHLIEGDHVVEPGQLKSNKRRERKSKVVIPGS